MQLFSQFWLSLNYRYHSLFFTFRIRLNSCKSLFCRNGQQISVAEYFLRNLCLRYLTKFWMPLLSQFWYYFIISITIDFSFIYFAILSFRSLIIITCFQLLKVSFCVLPLYNFFCCCCVTFLLTSDNFFHVYLFLLTYLLITKLPHILWYVLCLFLCVVTALNNSILFYWLSRYFNDISMVTKRFLNSNFVIFLATLLWFFSACMVLLWEWLLASENRIYRVYDENVIILQLIFHNLEM